MTFFVLLIFGLLAGALARAILPGTQPGGWLTTLICGVGGALLAGFLGSFIFGEDLFSGGFWKIKTWIAGIVGAIIVTFIWQTIVRRRH